MFRETAISGTRNTSIGPFHRCPGCCVFVDRLRCGTRIVSIRHGSRETFSHSKHSASTHLNGHAHITFLLYHKMKSALKSLAEEAPQPQPVTSPAATAATAPFPPTTTTTTTNPTQHSDNMSQTSNNTAGKKNRMKKATQGVKKVVKKIVPEHRDYRWEELQRIEKRRNQILHHVEEPTWKILLRWDGTVLRILAGNPLLWITLTIYVMMRVFARNSLPEVLGKTTSDSMTILGGFLSFFLVFYVNQNHKRFFQLYNDSMGMKGRIFDIASLAVTTLPFAQASRLVRYCNAAHAAGYVGLSEIYPSQSYFNHIDKQLGLLTEEERARMDAIDLDKGGSCNRELIVWCMNEIQTARVRKKDVVGYDSFG
jgi:Bestrophin, RFP-TM, chloride channel